jgi:predicted transcriptional regulator
VRPRSPVLTEQELEIMKTVWDRRSATVRDVYESMRERRKVAYTTVMTMMGILEQKGYLVKTPGEKANVYSPSAPRQTVLRGMVREFLDRVFDGAAKPLLMHLVEDERLSAEEIDEIARQAKASRRSRP